MKIVRPNTRRLICSFVLAAPFCWLAVRATVLRSSCYCKLPVSAVVGYVIVLGIYWLIQGITDFRRPSDGMLVLGLLSFLYALLLPALAVSSRMRLKSAPTVSFHENALPNQIDGANAVNALGLPQGHRLFCIFPPRGSSSLR